MPRNIRSRFIPALQPPAKAGTANARSRLTASARRSRPGPPRGRHEMATPASCAPQLQRWETRRRVPEALAIEGLQVNRREVRTRGHARCRKGRHHGIAFDIVRESHDVDEPALSSLARFDLRKRDAVDAFEALAVHAGHTSACRQQFVEAAKLSHAEGRAHLVQPVVYPSRTCRNHVPSSSRPWLRRLRNRRAHSGLRVTMRPPSPVVICLFG